MVGHLLISRHYITKALLLFASALAAPATGLAQAPAASEPGAEALSGLVVDAESGSPITEAAVTLEACCPRTHGTCRGGWRISE